MTELRARMNKLIKKYIPQIQYGETCKLQDRVRKAGEQESVLMLRSAGYVDCLGRIGIWLACIFGKENVKLGP